MTIGLQNHLTLKEPKDTGFADHRPRFLRCIRLARTAATHVLTRSWVSAFEVLPYS